MAQGELDLEPPYSHPYPSVSLVGACVWLWVISKGRYLLPPAPVLNLSFQTSLSARRLPGGGVWAALCWGRLAGARAGTRLLGESPSPPKSPKLAATSKDARNLHLAL